MRLSLSHTKRTRTNTMNTVTGQEISDAIFTDKANTDALDGLLLAIAEKSLICVVFLRLKFHTSLVAKQLT